MLIYDETPLPGKNKGAIPIADLDATKLYLGHFENSLMLKFFLANGTTKEKADASRELVICERKMKFWERQQNFDQAKATEGTNLLKLNWSKR